MREVERYREREREREFGNSCCHVFRACACNAVAKRWGVLHPDQTKME